MNKILAVFMLTMAIIFYGLTSTPVEAGVAEITETPTVNEFFDSSTNNAGVILCAVPQDEMVKLVEAFELQQTSNVKTNGYRWAVVDALMSEGALHVRVACMWEGNNEVVTNFTKDWKTVEPSIRKCFAATTAASSHK